MNTVLEMEKAQFFDHRKATIFTWKLDQMGQDLSMDGYILKDLRFFFEGDSNLYYGRDSLECIPDRLHIDLDKHHIMTNALRIVKVLEFCYFRNLVYFPKHFIFPVQEIAMWLVQNWDDGRKRNHKAKKIKKVIGHKGKYSQYNKTCSTFLAKIEKECTNFLELRKDRIDDSIALICIKRGENPLDHQNIFHIFIGERGVEKELIVVL